MVQTDHDLIGGPLAHGQIGDYLIQNDQVRFIISGAHHSWGPGLFGGTVVDADLQRDEPFFRGAKGNDQFAEMFTTVNLLVPDPTATEITILKDGKDGTEAAISVSGTGLMYLEALEILDPDSQSAFAPILQNLGVQTIFNFQTTYTLRPGNRYLQIDTVARRPDHAQKIGCPDTLTGCDLDCGGRYQNDPATGCLACACDTGAELELFTDTAPLLARIIGDDLINPADAQINPGAIGGDFVFFGGGTDVFAPGLGFDEKGAIFENLFRGVDTVTSPLEFDWLASVGKDVSYAVFTAREKTPETCQYRVVVERMLQPQNAAEFEALLQNEFGLHPLRTGTLVQNLIEQRLGLPLASGLTQDEANTQLAAAQTTLGDLASVAVEPDGACRDAKLLIPLFTSSATMISTAGLNCLKADTDDATCDVHREFHFRRYLAVGEGDVNTAMRPAFTLRKQATGTISGTVIDGRFGRGEERADIFAIRDPDPTRVFESYDALTARNLDDTARIGVDNHAKADVGTDPRRTGHYSMVLPEGSWYLVARSAHGALGRPVRITVQSGREDTINLVVDPPAVVDYRVTEPGRGLIPAKITFQALDKNGEPMRADGKRRIALGDGRLEDGIFKVVYSPTGQGHVELEAGAYRVTISRGMEYSIDVRDLTLRPGEVSTLQGTVRHEVDSTGYISGDFHLHAEPSMDSGMDMALRVITNVVEGIELLSSSDHDAITDYNPWMMATGLDKFASSQVGTEVTTLEMGHFLAFPLRYDNNDRPVHGAVDWVCKTPAAFWKEARALGAYGPDETIITMAHPRDGFFGYFDQFALNPWTGDRGNLGLQSNNPLLKTVACDFDTIELLNGKRFELIRTPTVSEVNNSERCLRDINLAFTPAEVREACTYLTESPTCQTNDTLKVRGEPCQWVYEAREGFDSCQDTDTIAVCKDKARNALNLLSIRRFLYRTPQEDAAWAAAGLPENADWRNPDKTECSPDIAAKLPAGEDFDADRAARPCAQQEGVVDDWFTVLNWGMNVAAMGNSDSHGTSLEPGMARTWVRSSTDDARHIDSLEITHSLKAMDAIASTGPFVTFELGDSNGMMGMGQTAAVTDAIVKAHVKVQTPSWFGVSRLEIYRNGRLVWSKDIDPPVEDIVDYDDIVELPKPDKDSWYVVSAVGLRKQDFLAPVYHTIALGGLTFGKITSLAFGNLGPLASIIGKSSQVPDFFPSLPYAMTNPVFVDIDGNGYTPPNGSRPPFCPIACTTDDDCQAVVPQDWTGQDWICHSNASVGLEGSGGTCGPDIIGQCGQGELATQRGELTVEGRNAAAPLARMRARRPRKGSRRLLQNSIGRHLLNNFVHPVHHHAAPPAPIR